MALKFPGWHPAGIAVSRAGEVLFSLCWQSPRDGVSKKILVVTQLYNTLAYSTILGKIYETNFSVSVKWRTMGKVQFQFLNSFFASIDKIFIMGRRLGTRL